MNEYATDEAKKQDAAEFHDALKEATLCVCMAIDPGPTESAVVWWDGVQVRNAIHQPNDFVIARLREPRAIRPMLVIEKIASFGMPVGAEVFETVYWSGRFAEAYGADRTHRITRIEVKNHLCHSSRAKDSNIRQALIDRLGVVGTKKNPGPLFGISGDLWSALAVGVTWWDQNHVNVARTDEAQAVNEAEKSART